jgi:hypothetical protein
MGYTTEFEGSFTLNKPLDDETRTFLVKLNETRRMKRKVDSQYGIEGELYVYGSGFAGQDREDNIISYNSPPSTQPSLWCGWRPSDDGTQIEWDGGEKFYEYIPWVKYIINRILAPRGYSLSGIVAYQGEDYEDFGQIVISDNKVGVAVGKRKLGKVRKA